jgi:HSP20 family protein
MDNIFRRSGFEVPEHVRRFLHGEADSWLRIEEYQDGTTLIVRADLPGVDPDNDVDITITITDDTLHILARRDEKAEHKTKTGYRPEIRYGEFTRSIALPRGVNQEDITATYVDGSSKSASGFPNTHRPPPPRSGFPAARTPPATSLRTHRSTTSPNRPHSGRLPWCSPF